MSGNTTETQTNQASTVQLPPWVNQASQQNYAFAQNIANRPLMQYQGQQVADVAPQTSQGWQLAATSGNAGQPQYDASTAGYMGILGQNAPNVNAGQLATTNLAPYLSPYTQDVINKTLPIMQQANALTQNQQADAAASSKAFGGSRQGVQQGVAQAQGAMNIGQMAAQLNQANFGQAQQAALADITNKIKADQGNQSAFLSQEQLGSTAAGGLESLGNDAQRNVLQQYSMLSDAGQQEQTQAQNQINANMNQFNQAWNYPTQQLNTLLASLGMSPYGQTQTTQGNQTTQTSPDYAQAALGLLSIGAGMFKSDKKIKKDIKKIGIHAPSGLPHYTFRFKGQPKSAPKTRGPIAQDVEKRYPGAVAKIGGVKHVIPAALPGGGGMLAGPGTGAVVPAGAGAAGMGMLAPKSKVVTPFGVAHRASDGNHYVRHPQTGKTYRVKQSALG